MKRKTAGFTLIELMIVIAIIAIISAIAIPGLLNSQRASNERNASSSLKTIGVAEADFRANDRDNNRIQDFWTADISGLFCVDNSNVAAGSVQAIKLIEVSVALADRASSSGGVPNYQPITNFGARSAKAGYWYMSLVQYPSAAGALVNYNTDTGDGHLAHNTSRWGAAAMPAAYNSSGSKVFIVNEANTMFKRDFGTNVLTTANPPALVAGTFDGNWPTDTVIKNSWSKMD